MELIGLAGVPNTGPLDLGFQFVFLFTKNIKKNEIDRKRNDEASHRISGSSIVRNETKKFWTRGTFFCAV
jgi:hypothetical protein